MMGKMKRVAILVFVCLAMLAVPVFANNFGEPSILPQTLWAGCEYYGSAAMINFPEETQLVKIKSSKPKVVEVVKNGSGLYDHYLVPLKVGTSKISVTYKLKGATKTVSTTYKVKKYPNAFSSVTVNGKKLDIKSNKYYFDVKGYKKSTAKVTVKLKKGWTLAIVDGTDKNDGWKTYPVKPGTGKMTFTVKTPKNVLTCIFFKAVNKAGEQIQYGVRFER